MNRHDLMLLAFMAEKINLVSNGYGDSGLRKERFARSYIKEIYYELILRTSSLFCAEEYVEKNPDLAGKKINLYRHYILHGAAENRKSGYRFNDVMYIEKYQDVREMGINPLIHYIKFGIKEKRSFW